MRLPVSIRRASKGKKRFNWLASMINCHCLFFGAEVGTGTGVTAAHLLSKIEALHLIEVAWYPPNNTNEHQMGQGRSFAAERQWERCIRRFVGRTTVIRKKSHEAAHEVADSSLDFVFIDADHSYKECLRDIKTWEPKVRPGGLISGHDYDHPKFPSVAQAVNEMFDEVGIAVDYVWFIWK